MTLLTKWRDALRARLIDDAGRWHKFWTIRIAAAGALIEGFVQWFPATATEIWNALPADMRGLLPPEITRSLPIILLVSIGVARVWAQKKDSDHG